MKPRSNKQPPAGFRNIRKWRMSRQDFLRGMLFTIAAARMPFLSSCTEKKSSKNQPFSNRLNAGQLEIVKRVQQILFPEDGNGPGASDIHAAEYLQWAISDPWMDREEVEYVINGADWVEETAVEDYEAGFLDLDAQEQEELIKKISFESWGEDWLSVILTFIFEALLSDPLYGGNPNEAGWKWLQVYPGYPRPDSSLLYGRILDTVNN